MMSNLHRVHSNSSSTSSTVHSNGGGSSGVSSSMSSGVSSGTGMGGSTYNATTVHCNGSSGGPTVSNGKVIGIIHNWVYTPGVSTTSDGGSPDRVVIAHNGKFYCATPLSGIEPVTTLSTHNRVIGYGVYTGGDLLTLESGEVVKQLLITLEHPIKEYRLYSKNTFNVYMQKKNMWFYMNTATWDIYDLLSEATINVKGYSGGPINVTCKESVVIVQYKSTEGPKILVYDNGCVNEKGTPMGFSSTGVPFGLRGKIFHSSSGNELVMVMKEPNVRVICDGDEECEERRAVVTDKSYGVDCVYHFRYEYGINCDVHLHVKIKSIYAKELFPREVTEFLEEQAKTKLILK